MHDDTKKYFGPVITAELYAATEKSVRAINSVARELYFSVDEQIERGLLLGASHYSYANVSRAKRYYSGHMLDNDRDMGPPIALIDEMHKGWWEKYAAEREKFRARLETLRVSGKTYRRKYKEIDISEVRSEMLVISEIDDSGEIINRFFPRSVRAGYTWILILLWNEKYERWKGLRCCQYCDTIFYQSRSGPGGRPRKYCTNRCTKQQDQKAALERQKKPGQRKKQRERRRK